MRSYRLFLKVLISLVLICLTFWIFLIWKGHYDALHPGIVEARSYRYTVRQPVKGVLLWREDVMSSPADGRISFPFGHSVTRVAKGDVVARINGKKGTFKVRVKNPGYFVPALDGSEGQWNYSDLWKGVFKLPVTDVLSWINNNSLIREGGAIGKIIPFPQKLRFIGYVDNSEGIRSDLSDGKLKLQIERSDLPLETGVRAFKAYGPKIKIYLTLPFFPTDIIQDRNREYFIYSGERTGVVIPESSVVFRDGRAGVFKVEGDQARFRKVEGIPLSEGRFFAEKGIDPGNLVVLNGSEAREGRISLW